MICTFSVPENERNKAIINWYKNFDPQERSRKIREILLSYLAEDRHILEKQMSPHISQGTQSIQPTKLAMIDISTSNDDEIDLDSRLNLIGIVGGE